MISISFILGAPKLSINSDLKTIWLIFDSRQISK